MKVIVTSNYEDSSRVVAKLIADIIKNKSNAKLGLATGSTPLSTYKNLIEMNKNGEIDFSAVSTVNLDEYCAIEGTHPQSYRYFMDTNLFNHINIDKANTFVANGLGDFEANAAELDRKVFENGTPDVQLLGIGNNGHIAFNEPSETLHAESHIENLTQSTIDANARFFEKAEDVPQKAITMGMRGILAADCVVLIASGIGKANAIRGLVSNGELATQNPSTFLKLHKNAVIVIDQELANAAGYNA